MLVPDRPKRVVSQSPLKETSCYGGCGAVVHYRTIPRVYCASCRSSKVSQSSREAAERQRRKKGVQKVKGTNIVCVGCGCIVTLDRRADAKYCRPCYLAKNNLEARERSAKKRSTREGKDSLNAWHRERSRKDPAWRVSVHLRVLMHRALGKGKAGRSWREFVPYSLDELMRHLERQFLPGMTWENRGKWHIDHIVPLASFEFTTPDCEGFKAAWAITNLRPLWALDNIRKNDQRTHLL